jgi:hypothetical protein
MTYRPAGDERTVVPQRAVVTKERIWLAELGAYLGYSRPALKKFAKRQGLLRKASGHAVTRVWYVSPYGAQRIIAYIRAIQGDAYLHGKQPLEHLERRREGNRLKRATSVPALNDCSGLLTGRDRR